MADSSHRRAGLIFIGVCVLLGGGIFMLDQGKDFLARMATPRAAPAPVETQGDLYRPIMNDAAVSDDSGHADQSPAGYPPPTPTDTATTAVAAVDDASVAERRNRMGQFTRDYFSAGAAGPDDALAWLSSHYADTVQFFGKTTSRASILRDKATYIKRWPTRSFAVELDSLNITCGQDKPLCHAAGIVDWSTSSDERGAKAQGKASFDLIALTTEQGTMIVGENSKVISR